MRRIAIAILISFSLNLCFAQVDFTANDKVPTYTGPFGYGSNMGVYEKWNDIDLANIAAGNASLGMKGLGVNSFRPAMPGWFTDFWGYDIRVDYFQHYKNLGIKNNTVFIGYPPESEVENVEHCVGKPSYMYDNMWLDIWDEGANGTPVNEENYYAAYVYNLVKTYSFNVKFWEILNEPDFDLVGHSSLPKDDPKSWWNANPDPCHTGLKAPIQYYVRMLRISYEVIKSVDPEAFISIAGLGYPSFLDAVLRNTDNPDEGKVTAEYPLKGGAYFDAMCYHSYPHFDGSLRYWSNAAGGFVHTRHSDAAADGVVNKKDDFEAVLLTYGYDGNTFPKKEWIITESNIPRKAFGEYIGSEEAQRNFIIKTLVGLQRRAIRQYHIFSIAERKKENEAGSEFDVMGLYKNLDNVPKNQEQATDMGIAFKTTSTLLKNKNYDAAQTALLQLPNNIGGAAFKGAEDKHIYVLWAKTTQDRSEQASAKYTFPSSIFSGNLELRQWDFGQSNSIGAVNSANIQLTASPIFLTPTETVLSTNELNAAMLLGMRLSPNPFSHQSQFSFFLPESANVQLNVYNLLGQQVNTFLENKQMVKGKHQISIPELNLNSGTYLLELIAGEKRGVIKMVKLN